MVGHQRYNKEYRASKKSHQMAIQALHAQRENATPDERRLIGEAIDDAVIEWNTTCPLEDRYFDLHGMTPRGAVQFARTIVGGALGQKIKFETGRGKHSKNGVPAIRNALLNEFSGCVEVDARNQGVLVVSVEPTGHS